MQYTMDVHVKELQSSHSGSHLLFIYLYLTVFFPKAQLTICNYELQCFLTPCGVGFIITPLHFFHRCQKKPKKPK